MLAQHFLHPFNGWQIHVVCGFIKKQNVRFRIYCPGQRYAAGLAAGKPITYPHWIKPHTHQNGIGFMRDFIEVRIVNTGGNNGTQCHAFGNARGLGQVGNFGAGGGP